MPISYNHKIILFHIPKTAGTSIEELFDIRHVPKNTRKQLLDHNPKNAYQHFLPVKIKTILEKDLGVEEGSRVFSTFKKIVVKRNPYERAVSTYNFLLDHQRNIEWVLKKPNWNDPLSVRQSFKRFLEYAYSQVQKCDKNDELYDTLPFMHHYRPQHHWFCPENNVYDYVFEFNDINETLSKFAKSLGISKPLKKKNCKQSKRTLPWQQYYDKDNLNIFEKTYLKDIDDLGYKRFTIDDDVDK